MAKMDRTSAAMAEGAQQDDQGEEALEAASVRLLADERGEDEDPQPILKEQHEPLEERSSVTGDESDLRAGYEKYLSRHEQWRSGLPTVSPFEQAIADELLRGVTEASLLAEARAQADAIGTTVEGRESLFDVFTRNVRRRHQGLSTLVPADAKPNSFEEWVDEQRLLAAAVAAEAETARQKEAEAQRRAELERQAAEAQRQMEARREATESGHNRFLRLMGRPYDRAYTGRDVLDTHLQLQRHGHVWRHVGPEPAHGSARDRLRWLTKHLIDHPILEQPVSALSLIDAGFADAPAEWLIEQFIPDQGLGLLHGPPRHYKGFLGLGAALAVANGTPAFGSSRFRVPTARPVLVISGEDDYPLIASRLKHLVHGADLPASVLTNIHVRCLQGPYRFTRDQEDEPNTGARLVDRIQEWVKALGIGFVIVGPLRPLFPTHVDRTSEDSAPLLAAFREKIANDCRVPVLFDHHDVKGVTAPADRLRRAEAASGGGLFSGTDWPIGLERIKGAPGQIKVIPEAYKMMEPPDTFRLRLERGPDWCRLVVDGNPIPRKLRVDAAVAAIRQQLLAEPATSERALAKALSLPRSTVVAALAKLEALGEVSSRLSGTRRLWQLRPIPSAPAR